MYICANVENVLKIESIYSAFEQNPDSNYYFKGESHNFWEIVVVMEGEIGITAGNNVYMLKKGQAVLHEPMEFHNLWSESNSCPRIIILSFNAANMPNLSSRIFSLSDLSAPIKLLKQIQAAFEMSGICAAEIKDNSSVNYQIAVKNLELFILNTIAERPVKNAALQVRSAKNYIRAVNVLENNLDKNLSVSDIAALCNMGEVSLKKTFSKYSGMGVMRYFNKLKVNAAIAMLKDGMTVNETSIALGFSNQNYFSTVFKRITGHSPSYYK